MKVFGKVFIAVAAVLIVLILALCCFTTVPTGYTGIVTTFGRVENYTFDAGFHVKSPFQKVVKMDNRTQKAVETLQTWTARRSSWRSSSSASATRPPRPTRRRASRSSC